MTKFEVALELLKEINELGYEAYIVGGFVRDYILSNKNIDDMEYHDIDIVTNIPLSHFKEKANLSKNKSIFNVIIVEKEGYEFEVSSFREKTIYGDVSKRDYTINSLFMNANKEVEGWGRAWFDLKEDKILRIPFNDETIVKEDAIRIMRGMRFASKYHLTIDSKTFDILKNNVNLLNIVDSNRLYDEYMRGMSLPNWRDYVNHLITLKVPFLPSHDMVNNNVSILDVRNRFLYCHFTQDIEILQRYFSLPNELIDYYHFCKTCQELVSEYELWKILNKKNLWNIAQELFEAMNDKETLNKCLVVTERGNKGIQKYISGKDVRRITGLGTDKRIGRIIDTVNREIFYGYDGDVESLVQELYSRMN